VGTQDGWAGAADTGVFTFNIQIAHGISTIQTFLVPVNCSLELLVLEKIKMLPSLFEL
jgi:hypothetical protein